jgi:hypothetical protein
MKLHFPVVIRVVIVVIVVVFQLVRRHVKAEPSFIDLPSSKAARCVPVSNERTCGLVLYLSENTAKISGRSRFVPA